MIIFIIFRLTIASDLDDEVRQPLVSPRAAKTRPALDSSDDEEDKPTRTESGRKVAVAKRLTVLDSSDTEGEEKRNDKPEELFDRLVSGSVRSRSPSINSSQPDSRLDHSAFSYDSRVDDSRISRRSSSRSPSVDSRLDDSRLNDSRLDDSRLTLIARSRSSSRRSSRSSSLSSRPTSRSPSPSSAVSSRTSSRSVAGTPLAARDPNTPLVRSSTKSKRPAGEADSIETKRSQKRLKMDENRAKDGPADSPVKTKQKKVAVIDSDSD